MIIVSEDISKAAEILNEENLVAIPTETVYGSHIYRKKR
jgi:tRNA A37 threonylcarbamoyladenosine synthetase subunit TsaC/SUA5/YrdC